VKIDFATNIFVAGFIGSPSMNFFPNARHLFATATGEAIFLKRGGCCCLFCFNALGRAAVGTSEQFCVCDPILVTAYDVVHYEG
jgi:hypothetical protein